MADLPRYPGTPRWVIVSGIIVLVLVVLVGIMLLTGAGGHHGPGRHMGPGHHMPPGGAGGHTQPSSVIQNHAPSDGGLVAYTRQ